MTQQSILITGCSSGIGHEAAITLKQRGYRVFAAARKPEDVAKLAAEGLESVLLDINDSASIDQALSHILTLTNGKLDALFNNAAYLQAGAVADLTRDMMRAQFETNVFGTMELTIKVLPIMLKQGYGRIIQNSSILGSIPLAYCAAYNASKYALEGFTCSLRQELKGTGVKVAILAPGPIQSNLRQSAYDHYKTSAFKGSHQTVYDNLEKTYFAPDSKQTQSSPQILIPSLIHALEAKHPHPHYYVGAIAKLLAFLKRLLPESALDWLIHQGRNKYLTKG